MSPEERAEVLLSKVYDCFEARQDEEGPVLHIQVAALREILAGLIEATENAAYERAAAEIEDRYRRHSDEGTALVAAFLIRELKHKSA